MSANWGQVVSTIGAVLILVAYASQRFGRMSPNGAVYLWMNFSGASMLCLVAINTLQIGFIIVEGAWALISLVGLLTLKSIREAR